MARRASRRRKVADKVSPKQPSAIPPADLVRNFTSGATHWGPVARLAVNLMRTSALWGAMGGHDSNDPPRRSNLKLDTAGL